MLGRFVSEQSKKWPPRLSKSPALQNGTPMLGGHPTNGLGTHWLIGEHVLPGPFSTHNGALMPARFGWSTIGTRRTPLGGKFRGSGTTPPRYKLLSNRLRTMSG